jgi:hypothetical protein
MSYCKQCWSQQSLDINMLDYAIRHDIERLTQCKADVKEAYIVCIMAGRLIAMAPTRP